MNPAKIYRELYARFGPQGWWPLTLIGRKRPQALSPAEHIEYGVTYGIPWANLQLFKTHIYDPYFDIAAGAILTQNTAWKNVAQALNNLAKQKLLTARAITHTPVIRLEKLIRPSGYFRQKTRKLKLFAKYIQTRHRGNMQNIFKTALNNARADLLNIWGIGEETADSILLYAGNMPIFIVDAYTKQLCKRHKIIYDNYDEYQQIFMQKPRVPHTVQNLAAYFQEFHALIVRWGKEQ